MSIEQILAELISQRDRLNTAIEALQSGTSVAKRRAGKKGISVVEHPTPPAPKGGPKKGRTMSAEGRRRVAEAQKRRWAAQKKQQAQAAT